MAEWGDALSQLFLGLGDIFGAAAERQEELRKEQKIDLRYEQARLQKMVADIMDAAETREMAQAYIGLAREQGFPIPDESAEFLEAAADIKGRKAVDELTRDAVQKGLNQLPEITKLMDGDAVGAMKFIIEQAPEFARPELQRVYNQNADSLKTVSDTSKAYNAYEKDHKQAQLDYMKERVRDMRSREGTTSKTETALLHDLNLMSEHKVEDLKDILVAGSLALKLKTPGARSTVLTINNKLNPAKQQEKDISVSGVPFPGADEEEGPKLGGLSLEEAQYLEDLGQIREAEGDEDLFLQEEAPPERLRGLFPQLAPPPAMSPMGDPFAPSPFAPSQQPGGMLPFPFPGQLQ